MQKSRLLGSFCLIALIAALGARPVQAQSIAQPRSWTVTPFIGASAGVSGGALTDDSLGIGAAVGYDLNSNLGFEGELGHLFDIVGDDSNVDWSVTNVNANALYHFNVMHVTPYATFGIGIEHSGVNVKTEDAGPFPPSSTEMAYNFGGGVKYRLNDGLIIRGDVRRFQAVDTAPDHWRVYGGVTFVVNK
jgi:opacity protein-like surface antigen